MMLCVTVHSLPDRGFYFDCLTQAENYWLQRRNDGEGSSRFALCRVRLSETDRQTDRQTETEIQTDRQTGK